jgi:hypothetical protein
MINPPENLPTRMTSHNAQMSPRLSRLYTWLQANRVQLSDFSTDTCVQRELPKLKTLAEELGALIARTPYRFLFDLAADLSNIMKRLPQNRVR